MIIKFEKLKSNYIEFGVPLLVLLMVMQSFPSLSTSGYILKILLFIFSVLLINTVVSDYKTSKKETKNISYLLLTFLLFPIYALLTSFWTIYPAITLKRSIYALLYSFGSISAGYLYIRFNFSKQLKFILPASIFLIGLTIFSIVTGIPKNSWSGGHGLGFMGFAYHQNTLAATLLFTIPLLSGIILVSNYKIVFKDIVKIKSNFIGYLLVSFSVIIIFLTYSRASLLALGLGIVLLLILIKKYKLLLILIIVATSILAVTLMTPLNTKIKELAFKTSNSLFDRRTILWEPSLEAAKNAGLFGIGYGVSDPEIKTGDGTASYYFKGIYVREKGNGYLAIIEETGLVGFILFFTPILILLKIMFNKQRNETDNVVSFFLVIALTYSFFETWFVYYGTAMYGIFYLTIGIKIWEKNEENFRENSDISMNSNETI